MNLFLLVVDLLLTLFVLKLEQLWVPRLMACATGISCIVMGSTTALIVHVLVSWMKRGPTGTSGTATGADSAKINPATSNNTGP